MKPKMKQHGYFGIGCIVMKTADNYGTLFRTAQIMGADFIFLIGCRFKKQASDTMKSWKHLPLFEYDTCTHFQINYAAYVPLLIHDVSHSGF